MGLTVEQMSLCFQSYWYMWLANSLGGLLFIGIDIGVAVFFLKKFQKRKTTNYQKSSAGTHRPFSPSEIRTINDKFEDNIQNKSTPRGFSARSDCSNSTEDSDDFASATLNEVNKARSRYDASAVSLNDQLSIIAQRWANHMAQTGKLEHSPAEMRNFGRQTLGENYAAVFQTELTASKMVRKWLKEGRTYQFGSNGCRDNENFTQLVWRATREIGVGRAQSTDGNWSYGVVVFDPPGNIPNQYTSNVSFMS
ncbi:hypothetical protein I4U23_013877 [Adineta vaga]|nr:hypothetical protein I4U23_013877 [Adineta vaga]